MERSSACEKQFHDFVSLVAERSDDSLARSVGSGSSDTLIARAQMLQGQVRLLSNAVRTSNLSDAYEEVIEFVNEFVLNSDLLEISRELGAVGEFRFSHRVPPGFQDRGKSENRYGDLVIWEEILRDSVTAVEGDKEHACIFVSQDQKTDWISASPYIENGSGPEKQNRDHANDVPLPHPLLQHEYEKRGAPGTVFVVTPRRLSIMAAKAARKKPELDLVLDEWGKVSYLDGLVARKLSELADETDQALETMSSTPVQTAVVHQKYGDFPSIDEVFVGSIASRLESARELDHSELDSLLADWLAEVVSNKLQPHILGRLLASVPARSSIPAIGATLAEARARLSGEDNARVFFGFGAALYFSSSSNLRASPSRDLGEIFLGLCSETLFSQGLSKLASALRSSGLSETFNPGSSAKVSLEIESSGSSLRTLVELRIDGNVVTQPISDESEVPISDYFQGINSSVSAEQLKLLVSRLYIIAPDRLSNSSGKRKFDIRPEMGLVGLDFKSPEGLQLPSED